MSGIRILTVLTGIAFLIYGLLCLFTSSMIADFHRFGLDRLRILTGVLEVLGGTGLLVGLRWLPALWISSAGLALLMLIAFCIRLIMHDSVAASLPSLGLTVVNLLIFYKALRS